MTNVSNSLEDAAKAIFELLPHNGTMGSLRPAWDQAENGLHRDEARRYASAAAPFFVATPAPQADVDVEGEIARVVQSVNEWDDRTSPDDYPDHLLITSEELTDILRSFAATLEGRDNG